VGIVLILVALMVADVNPKPVYIPSEPVELSRLGQRKQVLLVEFVPLGSSREAVKYKISGLRTTPEGDLEGSFPDHPGSETVRVTLFFKDDQLVCIRYLARDANSFRAAALFFRQTFGKSYLRDPKGGRGVGWCVNGMGIEMGEFVDSTGVETGWRFRVGCPDSVRAFSK